MTNARQLSSLSQDAVMSVTVTSHQVPAVSSVMPQSCHMQQPATLNPRLVDSRLVSLAADSPPSAVAGMPFVSCGPSLQLYTDMNVMPASVNLSSLVQPKISTGLTDSTLSGR